MDIFAVLITGLFAGGITCLAVQGGLLASSLAQQEESKLKESVRATEQVVPILSFLLARLFAYTVLGFFLGALGSVFQLSLSAKVVLQFAAAFFMIGTALNLLSVHSIFRYFVIQPPRALARMVKNQSRSKSVFGPALLGLFTVLIPCGATQAMMAYAMTTSSPVLGAVVMFAFILGTSPLFFLLGYAMERAKGEKRINFNKVAAVAIIVIALYNMYGAFNLTGIANPFNSKKSTLGVSSAVSEATINFTQAGYTTTPGLISVKAGSRVKLTLDNKNAGGCIQAFTIPTLGIQKTVRVGTSTTVDFVAPTDPGELAFMCSMGMYRGVIKII